MVLPITSYTSDVGRNADVPGSWRKQKWGNRQAKPFNMALPYKSIHTITLSGSVSGPSIGFGGLANAYSGISPPELYALHGSADNQDVVQAKNKAISKFQENLSASSQWAVNLIEGQKSIDMIGSRCSQIFRFTKALRKGDFGAAGRALGSPEVEKKLRGTQKGNYSRRGSRSFANQFLECHFGWEPLVQDIYQAAELISQPIKHTLVRGRSRVKRDWRIFTPGDSSSCAGTPFKQSRTIRHTSIASVVVQAEASVSNPNLHLANQLGLTNPAAWIWELTPFSFVVDWFVNVGDFLNNLTDYLGVQFVNPFWTYKLDDSCVLSDSLPQCVVIDAAYQLVSGHRTIASQRITTERTLTIPGVTLALRAPWKLSPTRAVTACSLLIQQGLRRQ